MSNVLFALIYFKHSYFWTQLKRLSLGLSNLYAENIIEKKKLFANASGIYGKERTFRPSLQRFHRVNKLFSC